MLISNLCSVYCEHRNFAQYIFSRISCRAIDARKFDVSENYNHNRTNTIKWYAHARKLKKNANMPPRD